MLYYYTTNHIFLYSKYRYFLSAYYNLDKTINILWAVLLITGMWTFRMYKQFLLCYLWTFKPVAPFKKWNNFAPSRISLLYFNNIIQYIFRRFSSIYSYIRQLNTKIWMQLILKIEFVLIQILYFVGFQLKL